MPKKLRGYVATAVDGEKGKAVHWTEATTYNAPGSSKHVLNDPHPQVMMPRIAEPPPITPRSHRERAEALALRLKAFVEQRGFLPTELLRDIQAEYFKDGDYVSMDALKRIAGQMLRRQEAGR